jgi:23S rRNA pseudouridine2604 synthase
MNSPEFPVRINKYLADRSFSTRRGADELIEKKKVFVNGKTAVMGMKINEKDKVEVRGAEIKEYAYFAYYKPRGIITHSPQEDEVSIEDNIRGRIRGNVFPLGRLDKASHGLIILTDDGRITKKLLSPEYEHDKEYHVTVDKPITEKLLKGIAKGVDIEGYITKPAKASELSSHKLSITLGEGKKHQIRRMCAALGFTVMDIKRVRVLNILLGDMKPGQFRKIVGNELKTFLSKVS